MEERRRFIRVGSPIMIQFPNPTTLKTERSFTQDVSDSGMRFPTTVRFEVGQEIPITLHLPFTDAVLHSTGAVMWVREISRHGASQYDVGVHFRWLEDPDRQSLTRHLSAFVRR